MKKTIISILIITALLMSLCTAALAEELPDEDLLESQTDVATQDGLEAPPETVEPDETPTSEPADATQPLISTSSSTYYIVFGIIFVIFLGFYIAMSAIRKNK